MRRGDLLEQTLDGLAPTGEGIAHHDDREIYIPGAFPGERVRVRIDHLARHHPRAHASLLAPPTVPHPARHAAPCIDHDDGLAHPQVRCSGCPLIALDVAAQRELKRQILADHYNLHVDEVVASPQSFGYRWSSKRVVGGRPGALEIGSYARGSHRLAAMHHCLVDHPQIVRCAEELRHAADLLQVVPYNEQGHSGDLRAVWFKTDGERVLVTLVTRSAESHAATLLPQHLHLPAGIAHSVHPGPGNNLRGHAATVLSGCETLMVHLAGIDTRVGPLGFLQPNPTVAALAYNDLLHDASGQPLAGNLAFDLYAGAGITTARLLKCFRHVLACEAYAESAAQLGIAAQTTEDFLAGQHGGPIPDFILANPPREGLGTTVCQALREISAPRLHIMSCGPAGLARDLAELASDYHLVKLRAYDTLPHTPQLELVAWLEHRQVASISASNDGSATKSSANHRAPASTNSSRDPAP